MICPKCKHKMRPTHYFKAGNVGETKRMFCDHCLSTAVVVEVFISLDPGYGKGAYTLARKIENGELTPILKEEKDQE